MSLTPSELGVAGEFRVASELILRGYRPLLSAVDDGVDIMLTNGATIQVKTASKPSDRPKEQRALYYTFTLHSLHPIRKEDGSRIKRHRMVADYLICWCVEDDRFYIIPGVHAGKLQTINIPAVKSSRGSKWDKWEDNWIIQSLEDRMGITNAAIGGRR